MLQCPSCKRILVNRTEDGGWKLRTRMVLFGADGQGKAICPSCKHQVSVPLTLHTQQLDDGPQTRLILQNRA